MGKTVDLVHEPITRAIIGAFYYVFNKLGSGLLESVYAAVIVETKSGDRLPTAARLQLANYLSATGIEVGLLLHFGPRPMFLREFKRNSHISGGHPVTPE